MPISIYRKKALDIARQKFRHLDLDMYYIGDDATKEGNDYPAFKAVGRQRSILVSSLQDTRRFFEDFLAEHIRSDVNLKSFLGIVNQTE